MKHDDYLRNYAGTANVIWSEWPYRIDNAVVKRLTGKDPITARGIYQKAVEFRVMTKFIVARENPPLHIFDSETLTRVTAFPFRANFIEASEEINTFSKQISKKQFPSYYRHEIETKGLFSTIVLNLSHNHSTGNVIFEIPPIPKTIEIYNKYYFNSSADAYQGFKQNVSVKLGSKLTLKNLDRKINTFTFDYKIPGLKSYIRKCFLEEHKCNLICNDKRTSEDTVIHILQNFKSLAKGKSKPRQMTLSEMGIGKSKKQSRKSYSPIVFFKDLKFNK